MPRLAIPDLEARQIREECEARRLAWERWYSTLAGCPWGCDGSGWREVHGGDPTPRPFEVVHGGKLWTFCQCNGQLILVGGRYEARPVRLLQTS